MKMSVLFDSNTYRRVLIPSDFPKDPFNKELQVIHEAITRDRITAYLSEVTFQLEAIQKKDRKFFFEKEGKPKVILQEFSKDEGIKAGIMPSNNSIALDPYRTKYLEKARELNVKVIKNNRIGFPQTNIPDDLLYKINDEKLFHEINDRIGYFNFLIEEKKLGIGLIKEECAKIGNNNPWYKNIVYLEPSVVAKYVAEWADGDAVSSCYGHHIDFFCTADQGKSALADSVLSPSNRQWITDNHDLKFVNIVELANLLS